MKNYTSLRNCKAPFVYIETDELCETTVYEYYLPFSLYIRIITKYTGIFVFLALCLTMQRFLAKEPLTRQNWKQDLFFKYKFLTLLYIIIGSFCFIGHVSSGGLINHSIESSQGKLNGLFGSYMSVFYFLGTFHFLPVLNKLLGFENNNKSFLKLKKITFILAILNNTPYFIIIPIIVIKSFLDTKSFAALVFSHAAINSCILSSLFTLKRLIKKIEFLEKCFIQNNRILSKRNKIHTLLIKLRLLRVAYLYYTWFRTMFYY
eukprot:snap_masked-scaffold_28-processed-gene-2.5-mRNA-1 protein AED:1.00 eAED:1.00 QI:0/0/0/0/1/1/3/0/261